MYTIQGIQEKITPIAKEYGVKRVYLFGSYAKSTAKESSDVDILIEKGRSMSLLKLSGMRLKCQEALNLPVDLVTTTGIKSEFYQQIKGSEVLLYEERA